MSHSKTDIRSALEAAIDDNLDYLFRFAFFRIGNREDAEDIVHNAFLKILERPMPDISSDGIRMYLFKTVLNMCRDYWRRLSDKVSLDGLEIASPEAEDEMLYGEYERIQSLVRSLPEKEADVVMMRAVDELPFVEIADLLCIPVTTAQYRYKSGMDTLRQILSTTSKHGKDA